MVVHDVVVLVPDIVVPPEDSHGVDVLIGRVGLLREGMPHVPDAAEEGGGLELRVEPEGPVEEETRRVANQRGEAVVVGHPPQHHLEQTTLATLPEEEARTEADPVKEEAGEPEDE